MPLVGFTQAEITAAETGPSLPEPVVTCQVMPPNENYGSLLSGEGFRPAVRVVIDFPVADDNEVERNKAKTRATYGLGSVVALPLKDGEGNRLSITARLFAQVPKEDSPVTGEEPE